jgi:hypothetical protein
MHDHDGTAWAAESYSQAAQCSRPHAAMRACRRRARGGLHRSHRVCCTRLSHRWTLEAVGTLLQPAPLAAVAPLHLQLLLPEPPSLGVEAFAPLLHALRSALMLCCMLTAHAPVQPLASCPSLLVLDIHAALSANAGHSATPVLKHRRISGRRQDSAVLSILVRTAMHGT